MKKILALLLVLATVFSLVACGGKEDTKATEKTAETKEPTETTEPIEITEPIDITEPAPQYPPVTIGDITIAYESAVWYDPYEDGFGTLLVYYNITNNSEEAVKPGKIVFAQAMCDGQSVSESSYKEEQRPELYNSFYNEIAPGETARCLHIFSGTKGGVYEITVMDMYHKIEEKLVFTIESSALETVTEA